MKTGRKIMGQSELGEAGAKSAKKDACLNCYVTPTGCSLLPGYCGLYKSGDRYNTK